MSCNIFALRPNSLALALSQRLSTPGRLDLGLTTQNLGLDLITQGLDLGLTTQGLDLVLAKLVIIGLVLCNA